MFFPSSTLGYCFRYVCVSFLKTTNERKKKIFKNEKKGTYQDPPRNTEAKLYRFRRSLPL